MTCCASMASTHSASGEPIRQHVNLTTCQRVDVLTCQHVGMLSWPAKPLKAASRNSLDPALTNVSWSRAPRIVRETIEGIWTTQNPKTPRPAFEGRARDILAEARDSA